MSRSILKVAVSVAVVVSVLLATALPAAALTFKGDGFYARFGPANGTDLRGLVIGDRQTGDNPRVTAGLVGLLPHIEFSVIGRSIGCNGNPSDANRLFRVNGMADANGGASFSSIMAEWSRLDLKSVWVNWGDGAVCQLSLNYTKIDFDLFDDSNGDAALGLTKVGDGTLILLVEKRPNGRARLSIVIGGFEGDDVVRIRLVNAQCGKIPTKTLALQTINVNSFRTTTVPLTQDELDSLRSVRVSNRPAGYTSCGPLTLINVEALP